MQSPARPGTFTNPATLEAPANTYSALPGFLRINVQLKWLARSFSFID